MDVKKITADGAWARLQALEDFQPRCLRDARFVSNECHRGLADVCATSPVFAEYAEAARVKAGYWAGKRYGMTGGRA